MTNFCITWYQLLNSSKIATTQQHHLKLAQGSIEAIQIRKQIIRRKNETWEMKESRRLRKLPHI